jgi:hypothetical protein
MFTKLRIFLLAALLPAPLVAQELVEELGEPEIRRYAVEIIVFRYTRNVASGSEVFLPDEPEAPATDDALEILENIEQEPTAPAEGPEPLPDIGMVLLEEEEYLLNEIYAKLELLDAYEPLMHFGWTQATWPEEQTEAIPLALFGLPPEGLDGTLTLYLSRFLHLVVDLELRDPESPEAAEVQPQAGYDYNRYDDEYGYGEAARPPDLPVYFRLQDNRILKNGELRYFDHPKFGVLAKVSRVEEEEAPEDGELLGYPLQ